MMVMSIFFKYFNDTFLSSDPDNFACLLYLAGFSFAGFGHGSFTLGLKSIQTVVLRFDVFVKFLSVPLELA